MPAKDTAVRALEDVGLTQYEAECFVALTQVPQGTAAEVGQLSDVPRSRVYDAVDRLHQRGLVDVQQSDPREYRAIPIETAIDRLRADYTERLETAAERLESLQRATTTEDRGVWAVADHEHVSDRLQVLATDATESITLLMADDRVVEPEFLATLATASERGVRVRVEVPSESVGERVRDEIPNAEVSVQPSLARTEQVGRKWPGRLLLVDREAALASGIEETDLPGVVRETAVWSTGIDHGFATWARELVADRFGDR